jgi:uncharacterized membrane protein
MSLTWIGHYAVAAVVFGILDFVWLGYVGRPLYDERLGHLLAERPNVAAAVVFYAIYIGGLTYFVTHPAITQGSWSRALVAGAIFGFVAYATWDLTNLAVLADFPSSIVPIDMAWGTFLTATTAVTTYAVSRAVPFLH